jgi:serine/threonine protein kinase/tetratricopeptide (TPR) repeat protein
MTTSASERDPVDQLAEEFIARFRRGERPSVSEYVQRYPEIADVIPDVFEALVLMEELGPGHMDTNAGRAPSDVPPPRQLGDYQIVREVGRGGMGVVYEAEQISLNRRVALKVLPFAATLDAKQLQRFKNEVQAAGQLHHQHIVPVYGVGHERGMHYYAMQFIDGQTLAATIDELRQMDASAVGAGNVQGSSSEATGGPGRKPGAGLSPATSWLGAAAASTKRLASNPSFLRTVARLGVEAAEALEHAHQLGIVHRDVKPANLLVDARGHLWITDFGLAHVQGDARLTVTGDLAGTLRYMSPEQALAKPGALDHLTDVYSLGVTLYEMLTLRPAFAGSDRQSLLRQIAFDEPSPPRFFNKSVPADFETIILRSIAKLPEERYPTAQHLADDLRRFLEDRPVQARRPTLVMRLRKWARRHQAAVVTAGVSLSLLLATAVALLAISNSFIRRESDQTRAEKLRADENLARAEQAVEDYLTRIAEDPQLKAANFHDLRKKLLTSAVQFLEEFARQKRDDPQAEHQRANAYQQLALVRAETGEFELAIANYEQARAILTELSGLPEAQGSSGGNATSVKAASCRLEVARIDRRLGTLLRELGRHGDAEAAYQQALAVIQPLMDDAPSDLVYPRELASTHTDLGMLWFRTDRRQAAEAAYQRAAELLQPLAVKDPQSLECREAQGRTFNNLGLLFFRTGRFPEADKAYRKALGLWEDLAAASPANLSYQENLALAYNNLSALLGQSNQPAEAEAAVAKAATVQQRLVDQFPAVPKYRSVLCGYYSNLGWLRGELGQRTKGESSYRTAMALQKKLADDYPNVPEYREEQGRTRNNLAQLLRDAGRFADAETIDREAVAIRERLVADAQPGGTSSRLVLRRLDLGYSLNGLAQTLRLIGKPAESEAIFRRALDLREELATSGVPQRRQELAQTSHEFARLLLELGRLPEAEAAFQKAISIREKLAADSLGPNQNISLASSYFGLSLVLAQRSRPAEAEAARQHGLARVEKLAAGLTSPQSATDRARALSAYAKLLHRAGRYSEAAQAFRQALELGPANTFALNDFAAFLADCPDPTCRVPPEAVALARKAVAQAPDDGMFLNTLGIALYRAGEWKEALAVLQKSINLRNGGTGADELLLAMVQWRSGEKDQARRRYDQAARWTKANKPNDQDLRRLRVEAAMLLGIAI